MKPRVLAVIPARYDSRRFPGKPLALIKGRPLIEHIYREAEKTARIDRLVVATDSQDIATAVKDFGGEVVMTSRKHHTGSDRTSEVVAKLGGSIIISIQADHLGVTRNDYDRVLKAMLADRHMQYASLMKRVADDTELDDPNRVKVICDTNGDALWFSRYPLPYLQGVTDTRLGRFMYFYHIGVYFYRRAALERYHAWPRTALEKAESLEQLRILEHHQKIRMYAIKSRVWSIDAPEDLE
ncbi:MAG: 3-deoxy-manno-octulosonate cytidylyltransferase [candidate division Zixibacteria bacterium]|nr:3-deoxy-manno-octulosonate cytidylyltransferase [candidate division Zixibacteria bacterium]